MVVLERRQLSWQRGFQPTKLWNLLTMMALIGSGGGLMFRSLKGYNDDKK